jgi:hypothetical protein
MEKRIKECRTEEAKNLKCIEKSVETKINGGAEKKKKIDGKREEFIKRRHYEENKYKRRKDGQRRKDVVGKYYRQKRKKSRRRTWAGLLSCAKINDIFVFPPSGGEYLGGSARGEG